MKEATITADAGRLGPRVVRESSSAPRYAVGGSFEGVGRVAQLAARTLLGVALAVFCLESVFMPAYPGMRTPSVSGDVLPARLPRARLPRCLAHARPAFCPWRRCAARSQRLGGGGLARPSLCVFHRRVGASGSHLRAPRGDLHQRPPARLSGLRDSLSPAGQRFAVRGRLRDLAAVDHARDSAPRHQGVRVRRGRPGCSHAHSSREPGAPRHGFAAARSARAMAGATRRDGCVLHPGGPPVSGVEGDRRASFRRCAVISIRAPDCSPWPAYGFPFPFPRLGAAEPSRLSPCS